MAFRVVYDRTGKDIATLEAELERDVLFVEKFYLDGAPVRALHCRDASAQAAVRAFIAARGVDPVTDRKDVGGR